MYYARLISLVQSVVFASLPLRGHWILDQYFFDAECKGGPGSTTHVDGHLWDSVHSILSQVYNSNSETDEQLLTTIAENILIPVNGEPEPTLSLQCPLGTAAVLQELGRRLVDRGDFDRGLRILHLAKLYAFHKYSDLGEGIQETRWKVGIMDIMFPIKVATQQIAGYQNSRPSSPAGLDSKPAVSIVSYCYYPSGNTKLPEYSKRNKEEYGRRKQISVKHYDAPLLKAGHAWMNKLLAVETEINKPSETGSSAWVMWVDCDAYFMTLEFDIEDFLNQVSDEKHLIISEDANMLNSAVFFLRKSQWSRDFVKHVKDLLAAPSPFSFRDNSYHEQSPLMFLILVPSVLKENTNHGYATEVLLVDQKMINAYPTEIAQRSDFMHHATYEAGDWIISFNGCGTLLGGELCEQLWKQYFDESMSRISSFEL